MAVCRIIFAALIALAVALAPVGMAIAACQTAAKADTAGKADMAGQAGTHDCAGATHSPDGKAAHSPDGKMEGGCQSDGGKCCQLTGTLPAPSPPVVAVAAPDRPADPPKPAAWAVKPIPPPPRS